MPIRALVTFPPPDLAGQDPCPDCRGAGITGRQYTMDTGKHPLVVDEFCPGCGGCGRTTHDTCTAASPCTELLHDEDCLDVDRPDEDDDTDQVCPSCQGRQWWIAQGFDDTTVHHLRVPCGCTEHLVQLVERADIQETQGQETHPPDSER